MRKTMKHQGVKLLMEGGGADIPVQTAAQESKHVPRVKMKKENGVLL